jgi:hypothetical protein
MSENVKKLYIIFTSEEGDYTQSTEDLRAWIANNDLDSIVLQKEAGEETDLNGDTHDYVTQFSIELPSLVRIKQQEGASTLICETVDAGHDNIINLSAEKIGELKAAYAEATKTPTARVLARRV